MDEYDKAIAATPEGQVEAFKLYIEDDTGTDRFYGNFPEEARAEIEAYAKEKGVVGKIKTRTRLQRQGRGRRSVRKELEGPEGPH